MKFDTIDKLIFESIKNGLYKAIPNFFSGELAMFNSYLKGIIILLILGEVVVLVIKRRYAIKQTKLFGLRRGD